MNEKLDVEKRESFGKGAARKLRVTGRIPAVIYGHGKDPVHVSLPTHETTLIVRQSNAILDISVDGKKTMVLVKDIQRDPVRQIIEHIDLLEIKKGERITVDVPVHVTGEPYSGFIASLEAAHLTIDTEATHIPTHLEVPVDGFEGGTVITARQVELPDEVILVTPEDHVVVTVMAPAAEVAAENLEAEVGEAAEAEATSEAEAPAEESAE